MSLACLVIIIFEFKNPFFTQVRLGKNKLPFTLYKIRSMSNGQVTRIGKIIRRTGIDELPQLINIIQGKMNFVGPRPLTQGDIERLNWATPFYDFRWQIKPGLTGLAQLSPKCHKKISLFWDRHYFNNQCLLLDLKVLVSSGFVILFGKQKVIKFIYKKHES